MAALLATRGLTSYYGDFQALFDIDVEVHAGEIVAIVGANGAGKSTFLKTVVGMRPVPPARVTFDGQPIGGARVSDIARAGITLVPEGRRLFPSLSVEENLLLGASTRRKGPWSLDRIYRLFPVLRERRRAPATILSGGQQQMAAIGRALLGNPRLILCDEVSLGLAPAAIGEIYDALPRMCAEGLTAIIVEQDVSMARHVSTRLYCFQEGRVALAGRSHEITREQIARAYFGV